MACWRTRGQRSLFLECVWPPCWRCLVWSRQRHHDPLAGPQGCLNILIGESVSVCMGTCPFLALGTIDLIRRFLVVPPTLRFLESCVNSKRYIHAIVMLLSMVIIGIFVKSLVSSFNVRFVDNSHLSNSHHFVGVLIGIEFIFSVSPIIHFVFMYLDPPMFLIRSVLVSLGLPLLTPISLFVGDSWCSFWALFHLLPCGKL